MSRPIFRLESEWNGTPRVLTALNAGDGYVMLVNEDDICAQSVVLSPYEVRWLAANFFCYDSGIPRWRFWRDDLRTFLWRVRKMTSKRGV